MPGVNIQDYSYNYPKAEIDAWQAGGDLSEELQNAEITFLRRVGDFIETSKNSKAHINYAHDLNESYKAISTVIQEGQVIVDYTRDRSVEFYKIDGKILIKHICHVMTLDNAIDAIVYEVGP